MADDTNINSGSYTFNDLNPGDIFTDSNNNHFMFEHMSKKDPVLGIDNDMYHFLGLDNSEIKTIVGSNVPLEDLLKKTNNDISFEDAKTLDLLRNDFMQKIKQYKSLTVSPNANEDLLRNYFNKHVIENKNNFLNKYTDLIKNSSSINLTNKEKEALDFFRKENAMFNGDSIENLSDEDLVKLTDENLIDWSESGDDFNKAHALREQARIRLNHNSGSQQAETNVEPNNPESIPQEAPQDVEEAIETHSDNTDTSTVEHTNKFDADDIVDPIEPDFRHNTVETKPRQRVKGRRKQSVDAPKMSKGRGKTKGSTTKTFTKGRNLAKGAGQAVVGKVLGEAAEQTGKLVDDVIEEGLDNVDEVIEAVEPEFTKPTIEAVEPEIEPEFNPDPLDTKAEVKKPQGQAKPDDSLKVDTDNPFDTTPIHEVEPVFDLGDEVDDEALKMLQEGTEGSISAIGRVANIGMNAFGAISTYKDARRKGHGVVSSVARAGIDFAIGELLGPVGYLAVQGAYYAGKGVIKGTEALYKENRRMNSAANQQVFGGAQFQDTQQLATMRQSGMEMAKMAQYNLQQTLMGNEATHLHR